MGQRSALILVWVIAHLSVVLISRAGVQTEINGMKPKWRSFFPNSQFFVLKIFRWKKRPSLFLETLQQSRKWYQWICQVLIYTLSTITSSKIREKTEKKQFKVLPFQKWNDLIWQFYSLKKQHLLQRSMWYQWIFNVQTVLICKFAYGPWELGRQEFPHVGKFFRVYNPYDEKFLCLKPVPFRKPIHV